MNPNKALWEKGDFTRIAQSMRESGEALVNSLGVSKGQKVLDLGCGDGTTALPEARLGADVLGVDIASNLGAPPKSAGHAKTRARSPLRSAPPPWPGRAGQAAPSVTRASSPAPPGPETEPSRRSAARPPRSLPPAPPWSSPPRTGECRRCAPRSPPSHPPAAPCSRQAAR